MEDSSVVTISAKTKPFAADTPYAPAFYEAIGRVVVLWGRFEQHLDADLQVVLNVARQLGIDEQMQVSLTRKTELLRSVCRRCSALDFEADPIERFTRDVEEVSNDRNLLIHSNVNGFKDGDPPRLVLRNISYKKGNIIFRRVEPSLDQINGLLRHIDSLNNRLLPKTFAWAALQDPRALEKARQRVKSRDDPIPPIQV